jgi:hypothetical protein
MEINPWILWSSGFSGSTAFVVPCSVLVPGEVEGEGSFGGGTGAF